MCQSKTQLLLMVGVMVVVVVVVVVILLLSFLMVLLVVFAVLVLVLVLVLVALSFILPGGYWVINGRPHLLPSIFPSSFDPLGGFGPAADGLPQFAWLPPWQLTSFSLYAVAVLGVAGFETNFWQYYKQEYRVTPLCFTDVSTPNAWVTIPLLPTYFS